MHSSPYLALFVVDNDASRFGMALGNVKLALYTCEVIIVMVDSLCGSKVLALDVGSTISNAVTSGPLLVTFQAG